MGALSNLIDGFGAALSPMNLFWVAVGVTVGTLVGILPGLGPPATLAGAAVLEGRAPGAREIGTERR